MIENEKNIDTIEANKLDIEKSVSSTTEEKAENPKPKKKKISYQKRNFEKRRMKGYRAWLRKKRAEMRARKRKEEKEKEKRRKKREREAAKRRLEKKKRPVGRPKKPGPKKKRKRKVPPKVRVSHKLPPIKYRVIQMHNGALKKGLGKFRNIQDAYVLFKEVTENRPKPIFPVEIVGRHLIREAVDEVVIIERTDDNAPSLLRNDYGKFVEQKLNVPGWKLIDKARIYLEETFWVWGYDNKKDRKTFDWIYENIIVKCGDCDEGLSFKRIMLFRNKIFVKDDYGKYDLIICKTESDGIRFYNLLEEWLKRDGIKNIILTGDYSDVRDPVPYFDLLHQITGWPRKKCCMKQNTWFQSNKNLAVKILQEREEKKLNSENVDEFGSEESEIMKKYKYNPML